MNWVVAWLVLLPTSAGIPGVAAGPSADPQADYVRDVKPILRERCYACHGVLKQESGLRLDTAALAIKGGDSGAAVVAGDLPGSVLVERIRSTDDDVRMPPEGHPLTAEQISVISRWIESGAVAPADEQPEKDAGQHWAFQKPTRPPIPEFSSGPEFSTNPIDFLLAEKLSAAGIVPLPPADKATLLRRVSLDLTGLPPSADELTVFLQNEAPDAYQQVVNRLLDSPQHGERWGRHWMDVWRYSDWYGRRSVPDVMNSYPMVWRWRDWIVRSINEDKPYDQMIVQMLAADELLPEDDQNIVATGFLVRSWFKWNYETWKKDLVEHTGKAFLGLTLNCCQCHDHKYDPLSQEEYFRFRAFFEPLELRHDRVPGEPDPGPFKKYVYAQSYGPIKSGMVRVFDEQPNAETFMFAKGDSRLRMEGRPPVSPAAPAIAGGSELPVSPIVLPMTAAYPGMKETLRNEERRRLQTALTSAEQELVLARESISSVPEDLRQELQAAEAALATAREEAIQQPGNSSRGPWLEGTQSLSLDAKVGRRTLSHTLPGLESLADNATISYFVQIMQDNHTNLQLALDLAQGATGGFVAFEKGTIKTYTPGGFSEFVAGKYDLAAGQNRFYVQLKLDLAANHFLLTVRSLSDDAVLVDSVPGALNGWKPQSNGRRGLFLDCRPGTEACYDALTFAQPDGTKLRTFNFEPPQYQDGVDLVETPSVSGETPFVATSYCQAPATSKIVSAISNHPTVIAATARVTAVRQRLRLPLLTISAAESELTAARMELDSLEQRIAADNTRYSTGLLAQDRKAEPAVEEQIHVACRMEREATAASGRAGVAKAERAIAAAEVSLAAANDQKDQAAIDIAAKSLQAAREQLATAQSALQTASAGLSQPVGEYTPLSPKYLQITSGRRAALAEWIASKDNPLTSRVAVNHIWLRHFGKALVETTHDFGRNGTRPTHPALLDWLACELMDSGWSMKHIHRLIVTSQAYQRTSTTPQSRNSDETRLAAATAVDPDNKTYWRFPAARMQAEVVRDSLLSVAGELDLTMGGHEIDHKLGLTSRRRSLYFAHHGEEKMEFLELFDAANACDCYKRTSSVQPQQALALTNSELTRSLSRHLAGRLWEKVQSESEPSTRYAQLAFLQVLNREPREPELTASIEFLQQQAVRLTPVETAKSEFDPAARARENLVHALMNHNDFVTVR